MRKGNYCPLLKKKCVENKCQWFVQVKGKNPNTGEAVDEWQCKVALLPTLMVQNSQRQNHTGEAFSSFAKEVDRLKEILQYFRSFHYR